jgi:CubicO group peptidase (beta-lactamase class C family)
MSLKKRANLITAILFSCMFSATLPAASHAADNADAIRNFQQSLIENEVTGSNVVMIFRDGKRVYHEAVQSGKTGDRDIDANTLFPVWSMTKPITTVAMMILHEQGKFDWNDEVSKYIPCMANLTWRDGNEIKPCTKPLRIIHLMTHRSGWDYDVRPGYETVYSPNIAFDSIYPSQSRFDDLQSYVEACAKHPLAFEPGTQYLYGISQAIQGRIVEIITGVTFEAYLRKTLLEPLDMNDTGFSMTSVQRSRFQPLWINSGQLKGYTHLLDELSYSPKSQAHFGDGGLVSTMADYARFCEMLTHGGVFRGKRILSKKSIDTMTARWSKGYPDEPNSFPPIRGYTNGFSLFVLDNPSVHEQNVPKGIYGWVGYHNTHFWIDPMNRQFGLFMSRAREFNWEVGVGLRKIVYGEKR